MGKAPGVVVDTYSCGKPGEEVGTGVHLDEPGKAPGVVVDTGPGGKPGEGVVTGKLLWNVDVVRDGVDVVCQGEVGAVG